MSNDKSLTKIILNMNEVEVHQKKFTYAFLANLAYPDDPPAESSDIIYTITVSDPKHGECSLARGEKPIEVTEGMVCNVRKTGRS